MCPMMGYMAGDLSCVWMEAIGNLLKLVLSIFFVCRFYGSSEHEHWYSCVMIIRADIDRFRFLSEMRSFASRTVRFLYPDGLGLLIIYKKLRSKILYFILNLKLKLNLHVRASSMYSRLQACQEPGQGERQEFNNTSTCSSIPASPIVMHSN